MNKHTPGPWVYCTRLSGSENHKGYYIKSKKFVLAFEVIPVDSDGKEGEANARLIAAAPELLSSLKAILAECQGYVPNTTKRVWATAYAVVSKATGETE